MEEHIFSSEIARGTLRETEKNEEPDNFSSRRIKMNTKFDDDDHERFFFGNIPGIGSLDATNRFPIA